MLSTLSPERRTVLAQLARFVISGATVTALGVAVYALVALVLRWNPQLGNLLAYAVAMASGYVMHSQWSFREHGGERTHATKVRFVVVSLISYALNSFWVWLLYSHLQWGRAAPIVPMLFVTPAVTFTLNRQWVFR
jgi:putative flippase GtrA